MIQLNLTELHESDIRQLLTKVMPVLQKRKALHDRYCRGANDHTLLYSSDTKNTKLPFEKYITDLASGYISGKPTYMVNTPKKDELSILKDIFGKEDKPKDYVTQLQLILKYITDYNDDAQENYDLVHDIFELTSCYEIVYENEDNEIVYSRYSPLQTVATWDYSIPANLTGLVRVWEEETLNGGVRKVELTDKNGIRVYSYDDDATTLEYSIATNWNDVPAIAVETDYAIFESCEDVVNAYEQLVQNVRNTYQYNDADCKLKISNYTPENPMTIVDESGQTIINQARVMEDQAWISARAVYVGEGGDISWLSKPVDADGFTKNLKAYSDLMFQLAGIPNTSDLAFNSTDLNTSAIDRKFYIMNMATNRAVSLLKKAYLRRWELILNRINLKKGTRFDFRDILVDIPKNLPANDDEMITSLLKLKNTISEKTIVEKLGYNYLVEREQMDEETEDKITRNIENMKMMSDNNMSESDMTTNSLFNSYDTSKKGVERDEMDKPGQETQTNPTPTN